MWTEVRSLELNNYYRKSEDGFARLEETLNKAVVQPGFFRCEQDPYWILSNSEKISITFCNRWRTLHVQQLCSSNDITFLG